MLNISKLHAFILKKNAPCKYQIIVVPLRQKILRELYTAREQRAPYVEQFKFQNYEKGDLHQFVGRR